MLFNSLTYLVFLPLVLVAFHLLKKDHQNLWLLAASWVFYGWWDYRFLALLAFSSTVDYFCGISIYEANKKADKKKFLYLSLFVNLGALAFFKYFNFFADSFLILLESLGFNADIHTLNIILPMGISFYTFQTMAYSLDIYWGKQKPTRSVVNFFLYVSYFPQLVAGPIERASHLLPQIEGNRKITSDSIAQGLFLITFGFFKKVAIADTAAIVVNQVFSNPAEYGSMQLLIGIYAFAIQIYCDFSGYTDIARGTSKFFGIDLMENFNFPYFSRSITEFWRRWHISLSAWLRDYLYIPLGGNRFGKLKTYRNLMTTMLLGGLWHGASWNFVFWGGLHGSYLSIERAFNYGKEYSKNYLFSISQWFITFHLVCFAWIFFRAQDFSTSKTYISGLYSDIGNNSINPFDIVRFSAPMFLLLGVEIIQFKTKDQTFLTHSNVVTQFIIFLCLLLSIFLFGSFDEEVAFIYFQF